MVKRIFLWMCCVHCHKERAGLAILTGTAILRAWLSKKAASLILKHHSYDERRRHDHGPGNGRHGSRRNGRNDGRDDRGGRCSDGRSRGVVPSQKTAPGRSFVFPRGFSTGATPAECPISPRVRTPRAGTRTGTEAGPRGAEAQ